MCVQWMSLNLMVLNPAGLFSGLRDSMRENLLCSVISFSNEKHQNSGRFKYGEKLVIWSDPTK